MKRLIVIGASSGLGQRVALDFARKGWRVGVAARREQALCELKEQCPENIEYLAIDVTSDDAQEKFYQLIEKVGGMDYLLLAAGCGWSNPQLDTAKELNTVGVNVEGFTRIVMAAYKYYRDIATDICGHIAVITSVAGTKGLGVSAAYSATKRYQWTYLQSLSQLAHAQKVNVVITDIRPGFVDTPLLSDSKKYPMEMTIDYVAPKIEKAILRERRIVVIDWRWAILTFFWRLIPNWMWRLINPSL